MFTAGSVDANVRYLAIPFFSFFFVFSAYVCLPLFIGIIVENFENSDEWKQLQQEKIYINKVEQVEKSIQRENELKQLKHGRPAAKPCTVQDQVEEPKHMMPGKREVNSKIKEAQTHVHGTTVAASQLQENAVLSNEEL